MAMMSLPLNMLLLLMSLLSMCHSQEEGSDHLYEQSPWFITLYITCPSLSIIRTCGGSLINDDWILTTATCVQCDAIPMVVADIGSATDNVQDLFHSETTGVGRYIVDKIVVHDESSQSKNNIAMLHLQYSVMNSFKHNMMHVGKCYQVNDAMRTSSMELLSHYAANADKLSSNPTFGDKMKLMKRKKCINKSATCKSSKATKSSSDFCATFIQNENMSCSYDEGMALGIHSGDTWIMVGFVSERQKDCRSCPTWFIDVCKYYEWIKNILLTSMTQDTKCPPIDVPVNGNLIGVSANTEVTVGTVAELICDLGSTPNDNSVILCQNDGTWSGPVPICNPLERCARLQQPSNGKILYQPQTSYVGSEMIYQCNSQKGEISRRCLPGGVWEDLPAVCKSVDPPNNVKAIVLAPKVIEVSWDPFTSKEITGYLIKYSTTAVYAKGSNVTMYGHNVSKSLLENLEEDTLYSITIQSISNNEVSGPSNVVSAITWTSNPSAAPQNVTALSANPSSVFVSWIPPPLIDHNGDLTSFTLLYSKIGSKDEHRVQLSANVTTYKIIQLIPSTKYRVKVACNNVNGSGPFSGPIKVFSGNNKVCQDVHPVSNGKVTYTGNLVGDTVKYQCDNGYFPHGPMIRHCRESGRWTGKDTSCEKKCPPLSSPVNGQVNYSSTTFSSHAYYSCSKGYRIVGNDVLRCIQGGQWSSSPPTCQVVTTCDVPPSPSNGYVNYSSTTVNSIATYHCNDDHTLIGVNTVRCLIGGIWSGIIPLCRKLCPQLSDQPYRIREHYDRTVGGKTIFSCIQGFTMMGVPQLTCKQNGKWNNKEPICYKKCPNARHISNGNVVQSGVKFGDTANYTCNFGYRLATNHIPNVVCQQNGLWSKGPPRCDQITCPSLSSLLNGDIINNSAIVFSRVTFVCNPGYKLIGDNVTVCRNDSTWTNPVPQCKRLCPKLNSPKNGKVEFSGVLEGNHANYSCDLGYELLGSPAIVCLPTGLWDPAPPICYKPCGDPVPINNGKVIISGRTPGSNATYLCNDHYQLIGSATIICQSDSQWLGTVPKCKQIRCPKIRSFPNGTVMMKQRTVGSIVNFTCDNGYVLYGPSVRNCSDLGTWTGKAPSCIRDCGTLAHIPNGTVTIIKTKEAMIAEYSCDIGYALTGNESITCNSDGKWTNTSNECEQVSLLNCSAPSTIQNGGVYVYSLPSLFKIARYYCDSGYFLVGNRTRNCLGRNTWSDAEPICKKFCQNPSPLSNGVVSVVATRTGQVAQYSCNDGYALQGVSSRVCTANGKWRNSTPSCTRV